MKRKDFWKGFGVALALVVVLNLAWKPICRAIPWHLLPFEISMSKDAKVDMIQSYLDKYYVEDIDQGKLEDTLFAGMLAGVGDKYTYYMPKENLRQYLTNTNGNFDGVGIEIYTTQDGEVVISSVMPGQPAETAGLQAGDVIIGVDGEENQGLCTGSENFWCVNNAASEADIQATLDFLYWCVTSEAGTSAMADKMGFVIPFKKAKDSTNPLIGIANQYVADGKTSVDWCFSTMPSEEWKNGVGSALTAYAAGTGDWNAVTTAFVDGWAKEYKLANG